MPTGDFLAARYATVEVWFESVAQLVEHRPFKALVLGSSPSALTIFQKTQILRIMEPLMREVTPLILRSCLSSVEFSA